MLEGLGAALVLGWREFWFLTDDAFITFRYIDHHLRGWGYTWNPPPFRAVEGYSNFLWMLILETVWRAAGIEPPQSANFISLLFSGLSLALAFAIVWRAPLPERWRQQRFVLSAAAVAIPLTNRTFLAWTSSGLETALFGFVTTFWLLGVLEAGRGSAERGLLMASIGAAAAALTRPDGVLFVGSTLLLALVGVALTREPRRLRSLFPLLAVAAHLVWRRAKYGEWVPNPYYAKFVSAWPEAGVRYTLSFVLEYAIWVWLLIALASLAVVAMRALRSGIAPRRIVDHAPALIAVATYAAHVAYYTFVLGGDHFEYRPYAHLIIPLAISLVRLTASLPIAPAPGLALLIVATTLSLPVQWVHYARSRTIDTRQATYRMFVPIADAFPPGPLRAYADRFDQLQRWMMPRHVGTRHQEHKVFAQYQADQLPSRKAGGQIRWNPERPVLRQISVGIAGWALPEVAILDNHGLNDRVVARNPVSITPAIRLMAHERLPPPGYFECFAPNVLLDGGAIRIKTRPFRLDDARIEYCESTFQR